MVNFRIDVIVDPKQAQAGARVVERSLGRVENRADSLRNTIFRAFAFTAVALAVKRTIDLADAYTNVQNRLRLVTTGTENLASVTERLFRVSEDTRSSYTSTAELYARVALSAKELGRTQDELLRFTERLNKAVILSGASATEASAGIIQLSQGIASGALRGDELRSVLEQLPAVADIIARSLGVTRGELRQLGSEGKLSAQVILDAFRDLGDEVDDNFAKTVPTVGQSLVVLRNNFIEFVGTVDQATGITSGLAQFFLDLATSIRSLPDALLSSAESLAPIIDAIIGFFAGLGNAVGTIFDALAERPGDAWEVIKKGARDAVEFMLDLFFAFLQTLGNVFRRTFSGIGQLIANAGGALGAIAAGNLEAAETFSDNIESILSRQVANVSNFGQELGANLQRLQGVELLDPVVLSSEARDLGAVVAQEFKRGFEENAPAQGLVAGLIAGRRAAQAGAAAGGGVSGAGGAGEIVPPVLTPQQLELLRELDEPFAQYNQRLTDLNALLDAGKISQEEWAAAVDAAKITALESATSVEAGFERAFAKVRLEAMDLASVVESSFNIILDTGVDVLDDLLRTGGRNFEELATAASEQIQRILLRLLVLQAVSALFPGAGALLGGAAGGLTPRQHGGPAFPGEDYLVGERGPERFRPRTAGSILSARESQPQQSAPPQITIVNDVDPDMVKGVIESGALDQVIINRIGANKSRTKAVLS